MCLFRQKNRRRDSVQTIPNMKKLLLLTWLFAGGITPLCAQDVIVMNNAAAEEIEAKVLEVSSEQIKYKKWSNPDGPTFTVAASDVFVIKYQNGEKQSFAAGTAGQTARQTALQPSAQRSSGVVRSASPAARRMALKGTERGLFRKGDLLADVGVGAINVLYGSGYKTEIPPLGVHVEYGVWDNIADGGKLSVSAGASFQYASFKFDDALTTGFGFGDDWQVDSFDAKFSSYIIGVHAGAHYYLTRNLDGYASVMLGYNVVSMGFEESEYDWLDTSVGGFAYGFSVGIRYYFTDVFHVKAELGYGVSVINVGLGVKF